MTTPLTSHPWFFCGIGGSGMLPLALILHGQGATIAGSDRSFDAGRTPEKFAWLQSLGITLHPQDGSGITSASQTLVASAAVEDSVPEVIAAKNLGCPRMSRAELLSTLFNTAPTRIAIGGTSGKSTVTGMVGWILTHAGRDPTIMNGAVMKNFAHTDAPFASARVGKGAISGSEGAIFVSEDAIFVSEVDESDGSIALYNPTIAVLGNVSLDHKSLEELRQLFGQFLARAAIAAVNLDDPEAAALAPQAQNLASFAIHHPAAHIGVVPNSITEHPTAITAQVIDRRSDETHSLSLKIPGQHNLANALAAIAAASAAGVSLIEATAALAQFTGLARRFDIIGTTASNITVIDDFGHNPDKVAATLRTLKSHTGRIIAFFQPHGYGPLKQMGAELAQTFRKILGPDDVTLFSDPVYYGGTTDRSVGSADIIAQIGANALHIPSRAQCADHIVQIAKPDDRIVIMGARDDTLSQFAAEILSRLS
jgi:UDP-N-acetylmuramate--alanine ligase